MLHIMDVKDNAEKLQLPLVPGLKKLMTAAYCWQEKQKMFKFW